MSGILNRNNKYPIYVHYHTTSDDYIDDIKKRLEQHALDSLFSISISAVGVHVFLLSSFENENDLNDFYNEIKMRGIKLTELKKFNNYNDMPIIY